MKKLLLLLSSLFLIGLSSIYSQDFDIKFSGVETNIGTGTNTFPSDWGGNYMSTQLVGNKFHAFGQYYNSNVYNNTIAGFGTDFSNSPLFTTLDDGTVESFTATATDELGNIYAIAQFYNQYSPTVLFGNSHQGTAWSYTSAFIKFDANGTFQAIKFLDVNPSIKALAVKGDTIYFSYSDGNASLYKTTIDAGSAFDEIDNIPNASINQIKIKNNDLYINVSHGTGSDIIFGSTTILAINGSSNNAMIGQYDIANGNDARIKAINFESLYYNEITDFTISNTNDIYITGKSQNDLVVGSKPIVCNGDYYQFICAVDANFDVSWVNHIDDNNANPSNKIILANHSLFVAANYRNYSSDGSFFIKVGEKRYTNVPLSQTGIYITQLDLSNGDILNSDVLYTSENGSQCTIHNIGYDSANDSLIVIMSSVHEPINSLRGASYTDMDNADFVKVSIGNIKPAFKFKNIVNANGAIDHGCTADDLIGVSKDLKSFIYHPDYPASSIVFGATARSGIDVSITDGVITIDDFTKDTLGLDSITITATDPLNNTISTKWFVYAIDAPNVSWDSTLARRCLNSVMLAGPDFFNNNLNLPDKFSQSIYDSYLNTYTNGTLEDGVTSFAWTDENIPVGTYTFQYPYEMYIEYNDNSSISCQGNLLYDQYKVSAPPTLTFTLPDTVCNTVDLSDYVNIQGGTFYQNGEGYSQLGAIDYTPYYSLYDNLNTGIDNNFKYNVIDSQTGCELEVISDSTFIKDAVYALSNYGMTTDFEVCDNNQNLTIDIIQRDSDSIRWYNDYEKTEFITTGTSYQVPEETVGNYSLFVTQVLNGCESFPLQMNILVKPSPVITFIGDTILCKEEGTKFIMIEQDIRFDSTSLFYNWDNTGSYCPQFNNTPQMEVQSLLPHSSYNYTNAQLIAGYHTLRIEDLNNTQCYVEKQIEIVRNNVPSPTVLDTTFAYGAPPVVLYANGDSIRWYTMNEALLYSGNSYKTGFKSNVSQSYLVSETEGRCESEYDTVTVTISPCPAVMPSFAQDTISYCENIGVYALDANNPTVRWFEDNNTLKQVQTGDSLSFTGLIPGYYTYYAASYDAGLQCYSFLKPVTLEVLPKPQVFVNYATLSDEVDSVNIMDYVFPKGGFFTSPFIAKDSLFKTSASGIGSFAVQYKYTDAQGCYSKITKNLQVAKGSIAVTSITIPSDTIKVKKNQTMILSANVLPTNATYTQYQWTIADATIASLTSQGELKGLLYDTTKAYVTTTKYPNIKDSVIIVVESSKKVTLDNITPLCHNDASFKLTGGLPAGGKYYGDGVSNGYFTPSAATPGVNKIGYTYTDPYGNVDSAEIAVLVYMSPMPVIQNITAEFGTAIPSFTSSADSVVWYNSLDENATAVDTGAVFEHKQTLIGTYTYYAVNVTNNCISDPYEFTLSIIPASTIKVQKVTASLDTVILVKNEVVQLSATITPTNATVKTYTWNSANATIATISTNGIVTAREIGTTKIRVTSTENAAKYDSVVVIVNPINDTIVAKSLLATVDTIKVQINESKQLIANLSPANTTVKTITWTSKNPAVASITTNGTITGKMADTTLAIVTWTYSPTKADTVIVIVSKPNTVTIPQFAPICFNASPLQLTGGLPTGGNYFGTAVQQGFFNPSLATVGTNKIGYAYSDAYGNKDTAFTNIQVVQPASPITANVNAVEYATIPNLSAQGDSIVWYASSIIENPIATGKVFNHSKTAQGTYSYYVVNIANACSSNPVKVTLKIDACVLSQPKIAARTLIQCEADKTPQKFLAQAIGEVLWYDSKDSLLAKGYEFTPKNYVVGNNSYSARQFNGTCYSSPISVAFTYAKNPTVQLNVTDSIVLGREFAASVSVTNATDFVSAWTIDNKLYSGTSIELVYNTEKSYELVNTVTNNQTGCATITKDTVVVFKEYVPVQSISVNKDTLSIFEGYSANLEVSLLPTYATNLGSTWQSADVSIVSVNNGKLYATKPGKTWVYAISNDTKIKDSTYVIVKKFYPVVAISLPETINLFVNDTMTVETSIIPSYASIPEVSFLAKEDSVISITEQGTIISKKAGMSTITAISKDGKQHASAVVYVANQLVNPSALVLPETIHAIVGTQNTVSVLILPKFATAKHLEWSVENTGIATISGTGVLLAKSKGTTTITVTDTVTDISATAQVRVTNTMAPEFYPLPSLSMKQTVDSIVLDLGLFAQDDSTKLEDLQWNFVANSKLSVSISGSIVTIKPAQSTFVGNESITFTVTDEENSIASSSMKISILEKANEAPIISTETFKISYLQGYNEFDMTTRVKDDYSSPQDIIWTIAESNKFDFTQLQNYLVITSKNRTWFGVDSITVTATDRNGLSTTQKIAVAVVDKPNDAPVISEIPTQYNNETEFFSYIELNNYVSDDYTVAKNILWSSSKSDNVSVKIVQNTAFIKIINPYWSGAEFLTLTAKDEHGAESTIDVLFLQEQSRAEGWKGKPTINFVSDKLYSVPNDTITLYSSLSGATSWKWDVEGVTLQDSSKVIQTVSFAKPGKYTVKLIATNPDGNETLVKEDYITIYGVSDRTPAICIGDSYTLKVNDATLDSYTWNTGATTSSIVVNPKVTTTYTVTIKDGLFTFVDKISVRVSVPVNLVADSAICEKSVYTLDAGNFETYAWNTEATSRTIPVSALGTYTVTTTDDIGCISTDSFAVTKINPLPYLNIGNNQTVCDGEIVTLDAGIGYKYLWSNGFKGQQVVIDSTKTIGVTITDNNMCQSSDEITITYRYPYTEQIGIVTFSETSKNIIVAWEKTLGVNTMKYQVYRETNVTDKWSLVGEVNFDEPALIVDSMANYVMRPYRYTLVTIDSCGNSSARSIAHRSMHLQTSWNADQDKKMNLNWSTYEPKEAVETYIIQRGVSFDKLVAIDSMASDYSQWTDPESNPDMVYRVVFRLYDTINENHYNLKAESGPFSLAMSNIAEAENITEVNSVSLHADVAVYPVPVKDVINVAIVSEETDEYTISLIDASGKTLDVIQTEPISQNVYQIPATYLANGNYTIQVSTKTGSKVVKIVK